MYQFSYAEVIDDSPSELRARERAALTTAIDMLRAAQGKGSGSKETIEAFYFLRQLWAIFIEDLDSSENELPRQLRAALISIGIWIDKEMNRVTRGETEDLTALIEINEIIREGLV